uniref:Uncharacterized protein n=1 Tax=Anguilla anguilla TaxID=7936 RepID=A0A0E9V555_ANGAN
MHGTASQYLVSVSISRSPAVVTNYIHQGSAHCFQ